LLDNKLYLAVKLFRKKEAKSGKKLKKSARYALVKIPTDELGRFVKLPDIGDNRYYFLFLEDLIRINFQELFPGYDIESSYIIKMLRDADLGIQDEFSGNLVEKIRKSLKSHKRGEPALFLFDRDIPQNFLYVLTEAMEIFQNDMLPSNKYLNVQDFIGLPNPFAPRLQLKNMNPVRIAELESF
jgi:polyphosphate kinase